MFYILSFWMLFLLDTAIVLFSFTIFVCMWMSTLLIMYMVCVIKMNNTYITWEFMSSKYIDMYWFTLGSLFMLCLLLRLCLLLYFGCLNFMSFDLCKCMGFQWYWMYYMFNDNTMFSNLILESDYFMGDLRLLQCNHILTLLSLVMYKLWLSSMDVMHSFTLSSLGIKMEVPGSCNELMLFCCTNATLYGQCSELCGVLHGFMPMVVYFM